MCLQGNRLYQDLTYALSRNKVEFVHFFVEKVEAEKDLDLRKFITNKLSDLYWQV